MKTECQFSWPLALCAGIFLGGCASERVVLLPSADSRAGSLVVRDAGSEIVLAKPYAGVVRRAGENSAYQSSPQEVEKRFAAALAARPVRPRSFTLYFEGGSEVLMPASLAEIEAIKREMASRQASEVMIIGHTDSLGSLEANDKLSLKRAAAAREILIGAGVPSDKIETAGRGEREPLVASEDEVAEAKNRRVEISVR